jgi:hypothetical protein
MNQSLPPLLQDSQHEFANTVDILSIPPSNKDLIENTAELIKISTTSDMSGENRIKNMNLLLLSFSKRKVLKKASYETVHDGEEYSYQLISIWEKMSEKCWQMRNV